MCSVMAHAAGADDIHFYIFSDSISPAYKNQIQRVVEKLGHAVSFIEIPFEKFPHLEIHNKHLSRSAFGRLLLGSLLPAEIERAVYLDCDVLALSSLAPLAEADLQGCIIGGVGDLGIERLTRLQAHPWDFANGLYINSGVLSVDVRRWRAEHTESQLLQYLQSPAHPLKYEDQDVLNFVLAGRIKLLDPRWNAQMYWLEKDYDTYPAVWRKALEHPYIVHFAARSKPWKWGAGWHPYILLWRKYLKMAGWKPFSAPEDWKTVLKMLGVFWWRHPLCWLRPGFYKQLRARGIETFR